MRRRPASAAAVPTAGLRPGEATTYVDLAGEFAQKWSRTFRAQAEAEAQSEVARHAARQSAIRRKSTQRLKSKKKAAVARKEKDRRRLRIPQNATLRGLGGRLKSTLRERRDQHQFRWDSIYAPTWTDKSAPPPTAYKEFKVKYEKVIGHEEKLRQAGEPVIARTLPKIPAAPPAFDGAMDLDWHAGVESATANIEKQEKKLAYDMKKSAMSPDERIVAQRLTFSRPIPKLRDATQRFAAADASLRRRRGSNVAISRVGDSDSDSLDNCDSTDDNATLDTEASVARAEGALGIAANNFFAARFQSLNESCDPKVARAKMEEFVELQDERGHEKILQHRELQLNNVARQWSEEFVVALMQQETLYEKWMVEMSPDGLDTVGRLDSLLPPFESKRMRDCFQRLQRMGLEILRDYSDDDEDDHSSNDETDSLTTMSTTMSMPIAKNN